MAKSTTYGEVIEITKLFDEATCQYFYSIRIAVEEQPRISIGPCRIEQ